MIRDLGKFKYFKIKKIDLEGLVNEDYVEFSIEGNSFKVSVRKLLDRFATSKDWDSDGEHKYSSSIPKWVQAINEYANDYLDPVKITELRTVYIWDILVNLAKNREVITYGELAKRLECHHRPLNKSLGIIQDEIVGSDLPALNILVVNKSGFPGKGFTARDVTRFNEFKEEVYAFDWGKVENPFEYLRSIEKIPKYVHDIKNSAVNIKSVYAQIESRGAAQVIFRTLLLDLYEGKCAFCGISFEEALEAAHIIPWSKCSPTEKRIDPRNGLLLCSNHHKIFDSGYITVTKDYLLKYFEETPDEEYTEQDIELTIRLNNKKIHLPKEKDFWPCLESLEYHWNIFEEE